MDTSIKSVSEEDNNSDSWSIVKEKLSEEGIDFEIVEDLFANYVDNENDSVSSEAGDVVEENVEPTVISIIPNEESEVDDVRDNEEDVDILVDFNPSNNSLKKHHNNSKQRFNFHEPDLEKNDPYQKTKKRTKRFYKCPFVTGVSLGTILTVCGLSLILKSSDKTAACLDNDIIPANLSKSLTDVIEDNTVWLSGLEEENLIQKHCPKIYKEFIKEKDMRMKYIKRINRKLQQKIREYDVKALKPGKQCEKSQFIGPLKKNESPMHRNEENSNFTSNFCKQKDFNDTFIFQTNICPLVTRQTKCSETSKDGTKTNENNSPSLICENKTPNTQTEENNQPIIPENIKLSQDFSDVENSYRKLQHSLIAFNYETCKEGKKLPIDEVTKLENKLNVIKEENKHLVNIINHQEKLLETVQVKLIQKKKLLKKKILLQKVVEKHLQIARDRKNTKALKCLNNFGNKDRIVSSMTGKVSDNLLDEMLLVTIKNNLAEPNTANTTESDDKKEHYCLFENNTEYKSYGSIQKENEYQPNISLMKRRDAAKKPKESLDISLEKQKLIDGKTTKIEDEEDAIQNNQYEKCDLKTNWIRKRNEIY